MRHDTIDSFLDRLADRVPAPGGGAAAALNAAQAAALLAMVARYSDTARYAANAETISRIRDRSDALRHECLDLAEADAAAFGAVGAAYQLPKDTEPARADRSTAIAAALLGAAEPPAAVVVAAGELVTLAEQLHPVGNPNVVTDVAAAVDAARAAATTARVNVEVNIGGITDPAERDRLRGLIAGVDEIARRADAVSADVRTAIAS